jgi:dolichol-phosphate mannosyltransferase
VRFLVVLPTYNEAENVLPLSRAVLDQDERIDVLVVDDASPDGTGDLVERAGESEPRLGLLRRAGKLGLGTAYLAGFRHGLERGYGWVLTMDCDFSHHPRYLPDLLAASADFDLVIGSRYVPGGGVANWPLHRRFLSSFANLYTRLLLRLPTRDCTSGFRCYRREVLEQVDPFGVRSSGYSFLEEMVWRVHRAGFSIGETPILFEDRRAGSSKISRAEIGRAALHVLATALRPPPASRKAAPRRESTER